MTGREFLQQIRHLKLRVRSLEDELKTVQQSIDGLSGMCYDRDRVDGGVPPDLADKLARVTDLKLSLCTELDSLIRMRAQAMICIDNVLDERYSYLLTERYICGNSRKHIAQQMHLDKRWVFRLHRAALDAFDEVYQDFDHLKPPGNRDIIKM